MRITDTIYLLESTKGSYAYLVMGQEPVLIDTGNPGKSNKILQEIQSIGMNPQEIAHILLTHHDVDHIGNAKALQEATKAQVWAPKEDVPYIHGDTNRPGIKRLIQTVFRHEKPRVDQQYGAGQVIGDLEVIPTPGHTPGHVSIRYGDVLFAGDLVMSAKGKLRPAPGFLNWDRLAVQKSLREVGRLRFDLVCPAHGAPVQRGDLWDALMSY